MGPRFGACTPAQSTSSYCHTLRNTFSTVTESRTKTRENSLVKEKFSDPLQDVGVGDTCTRIVETRRIDHNDVALADGVVEADNLDLAGLGSEGFANLDVRLSREEPDELEENADTFQP